MSWDYFSQFWNNITAVTISGVNYTIDWFQSIGNAVGGAIGSFFDLIVHFISDMFLFMSWFGYSLKTIFLAMLSPVSYFFQILKSFFGSAFGTATTPAVSYTFTDQIMEIFQTIPYWSTYGTILGAVLILVMGLSAIRLLLKT
jgi:hypothetical protein